MDADGNENRKRGWEAKKSPFTVQHGVYPRMNANCLQKVEHIDILVPLKVACDTGFGSTQLFILSYPSGCISSGSAEEIPNVFCQEVNVVFHLVDIGRLAFSQTS